MPQEVLPDLVMESKFGGVSAGLKVSIVAKAVLFTITFTGQFEQNIYLKNKIGQKLEFSSR